jgi:hypothetical protein
MGKGRGAVGRKGFSFFYAAKGNDRYHASLEGGWLLKVIFLLTQFYQFREATKKVLTFFYFAVNSKMMERMAPSHNSALKTRAAASIC